MAAVTTLTGRSSNTRPGARCCRGVVCRVVGKPVGRFGLGEVKKTSSGCLVGLWGRTGPIKTSGFLVIVVVVVVVAAVVVGVDVVDVVDCVVEGNC